MSSRNFLLVLCFLHLFLGENHAGALSQWKPSSLPFLDKLLETSESLKPCSLFLFQDGGDNGFSASEVLQFPSSLRRPYYSVKYAYPSDSKISELFSTVHEFNLPTDNITQYLTSPDTLPLRFPITVSNYRKRVDQCFVVILLLEDIRPIFIKQIYNLLTPVYIPITRKDEDFYIFLTPEEKIDELLLMRELPSRIKYKLAISHKEEEHDSSLVVKSVCFFCNPGGMAKILEFPVENEKGISLPDESFNYFPDFVIDLNGRTLHIACPYIRARIEADPPWEGITNARRGIWKMLFEEYLNLKFNFSYHIFVSSGKDGNYGGGGTGLQLPNGTWIGVTGDLITGKADIGIVTANTPKRIHYIDFTNSFFDFGYLTYVTSQGQRVFSPLALLWPFDILMWFLIFCSTIVAFIFFTFIIKAIFWLDLGSSDSLNFARRGMVSQQIWNFPYQIQFVMTSFLDQDCVLPTFTPLRCFVSIWLFFTLVITTVYRSKLVSLLAFPIIAKIPRTFDDLAYSDYDVGFMKHGDSAYNTLAASTDPVYVKLVKEMEIDAGVGLACLQKVVSKKYGCIAYDFAIRHLKERNLSDSDTRKLVFAPAHTYNIFLGLATEGKSIYRGNFGKWLSYTRAFHLPDIWEPRDMYHTVRTLKRDWWIETNQTEHLDDEAGSGEGGDEDLTLKHISGSFYILIALLAICTVRFLWELAKYYGPAWGKRLSKGCKLTKIACDRMFVLSRRHMDEYT